MDARRRTSSTVRLGRTRPVPPAASPRTTSWIIRGRSATPPPAAPLLPLAATYTGELPPQLLDRLVSDPLFAVMSSDRVHWICPYTGRSVNAGAGRLAAARSYLEHSGVWRNLEPLSLGRLAVERWRHDLTTMLSREPRLRLFSRHGRGWLNPYSGELHADVALEDGNLSPKTIVRMAEILAATPANSQMLTQEELLRRYAGLRGAAQAALSEHTDTTEVVWIGGDSPLETPRPGTEDLSQAQRVQARSLTELPDVPGVDLGVHFAPRSGVSGDFYHVCTLSDGRLFLAVGDVSGHGVQAALVVASALKTLRFVLRGSEDLVEVALACNDELRQDLLPGQFISLFLAVIDSEEQQLTALCCGHHTALLANLQREQPLLRIGRSGMALGLADRATLGRLLKPVTLATEPGDILVQVTDGIIEATDADDRFWGEGRWMASLLARVGQPAQELADGHVADCLAFTRRPVADDLTVLVAVLADDDGSN